MTFPEFDEDLGLQNYLNAVQKAVKNNNWTVASEVGLSLFAFLKINMYSDLDRSKENLVSNPIVRTIAGDASAAQHIPEELNDYDFDKKLKPVDVFQVVDADSSQQEAILCAKKGISFVLQGPPGTGKSQTITNIIAECLADGKKVLFVSEKMAALDVVHKRLTSAGLDDFCLVLHSHKANKKAVLEQLRKSLSLAHNKAQLSNEAYMKLETLYQDKEKLNQYAEQIFETVSPLNMTIYQVNGILAELDDYPDVIFSIPDIRSTSVEQYHRYLYVLNAFKNTIGKMSEDFDGNPWRGSIVSAVTNELRHDVNARFPAFASNLSRWASQANDIFSSVWKIYRIWSTDWIKDPVAEGNRLIEAIEDALKNYGIYEPVSPKSNVDAEDFVSLEEKVVSIEDIENPYGFEEEQQVSFAHLSRNNSGYLSGADCIMEIVNRLYPVHYDLICQHLAPLLGNTKATVKVKREVDYQLQQLGKKLIRKGDFFFPAGYTKISPRVNSRKINHISTEELAEAMYRVLSKSVGLTKELLCAETARAYNFHRMTQNITSAINEAFELLVKQERIEIIEGKVSIFK